MPTPLMMVGEQTYRGFAEVYERASLSLSEATWREGIIKNLRSYETLGQTALDLGCGTGIGGRLMSGLGLGRIVGIDRSPDMLRSAGRHYSELLLGDIAALGTGLGPFDYIVSGGDTFNYLSRPQLAATLKRCGQILRGNDSRLIFDYSSPAMLRELWRDLSYKQSLDIGRVLQWSHMFNEIADATTTRITFMVDGKESWTEHHVQYTMTAEEMSRLFREAGLEIENLRDVPGDSYCSRSRTHLYSARKQKIITN